MYKLIGIETEEEEGDTGIFEFRPVGFGLQVWGADPKDLCGNWFQMGDRGTG